MTNTHDQEISISLIKACFESEHYPNLFTGHGTHDSVLRFIGQIVGYTQDEELITRLIESGLPQNYTGNSMGEVPGMIEAAIEKNYHHRETSGGKKSPAAFLIAMIENDEGIELFHDPFKRPFISIRETGAGTKNYPLMSSAAQQWLKQQYYKRTKKVIPATAFKEVQDLLMAKALYDCVERKVFLRIARHEDSIILNLANKMGEVVIINGDGYKVTTDSPVAFVNSRSMAPLPPPVPSTWNALGEFQELLGISQRTFHLILAFILNCLKPEGPYYFLLVEGEQGSGKSFLCDILKTLIDPGQITKMRMPKTEQDLMIATKDNFILLFDNVSGMKGDMSDALCSLSTGGGFVTRKLYTDDESQIFDECRPYIINGISGIAQRPDLLDRSISINLPSMLINKRKRQEDMLHEFYALQPLILGALLKGISHALCHIGEVKVPISLRMIDAAKWLVACEGGLGLPAGSIITALEESQQNIIEETLSNNAVATAIIALVEYNPFEDTVGELFKSLQGNGVNRDKYFPKTTSHLSKEIFRLKPALEKVGIIIKVGRKSRRGKFIKIWKDEDSDAGKLVDVDLYEKLDRGIKI